MQKRWSLPAAALLTVVLAVPAAALATQAAPAPDRPATAAPSGADRRDDRPNVIVVTADDMRADDLRYMPRTRRALGQLELTEFVSNHPLCCPARAELLTGQFGQNNGVHHNGGVAPWGGYRALRAKNNTVGRWFQRGGYDTAVIGKYINGWRPVRNPRPQGWSSFMPLVGNTYSAFHYSYMRDDRRYRAPEGLHTNDFVTRESVGRIRAHVADPVTAAQPLMMWSSYVAPHAMTGDDRRYGLAIPAERHLGTLDGVVPTSESKPSYEDPTGPERARAAFEDAESPPSARAKARAAKYTVREINQARLESLLSIDEGVGRLVKVLRRTGELDRTVIVFTSDNGFLLGEHGDMGKNSYYEESLRVPFLARGPGVATGQSPKNAMMTDLAPSLAALGGVTVERAVDGRSDLFALDGGWPAKEGLLIQAGSDRHPWKWRGIRTDRYSFVRLVTGEALLFDREQDPYQLSNITGQRPGVEEDLDARTPALDAPDPGQ